LTRDIAAFSAGKKLVLYCVDDKRRTMERSEAIAKLKLHEAELKRLGVDHLARSLGLFELMDLKEAEARILGRKTIS